MPDDLWERVAPLPPPAPGRRHRHPGRLRVPDRAALAGIIYALRTGATWRDVPAQAVGCSGVTAWRRLRDRSEAGLWPRLLTALLPLPDAIPPIRELRGLRGRPRRRPRRLFADRATTSASTAACCGTRGIKPMIARRGVAQGSGLGKVRWVHGA